MAREIVSNRAGAEYNASMTPAEFRAARLELGFSCEKLARRIGVSSGRTVRRWEAGDRTISGPAIAALRLLVCLREQGIRDPFG